MLVSLYLVQKKLFSIIFTCLNMLSLFCDKIFMSKQRQNLNFLGQNFKISRSKSGCPIVITNQNLFESKKSSRIKAIKYHATTNIFSILFANDAHKQRENIWYLVIIKDSTR